MSDEYDIDWDETAEMTMSELTSLGLIQAAIGITIAAITTKVCPKWGYRWMLGGAFGCILVAALGPEVLDQ